MVIYFNEAFIEDQFLDADYETFTKSLREFNSFSELINLKRKEYSTQKIYFKTSKSVTKIVEYFDDKNDLCLLFLENLSRLGVKYWNDNPVQNPDYSYFFLNTDNTPPELIKVINTSLAEAAEVKKNTIDHILTLNLPDLKFSKQHHILIHIISKGNEAEIHPVFLDCADSTYSVNYWVDQKLSSKLKYSDFSRTPIDEETCLTNKTKYSKLDGVKDGHGRQIYTDVHGRFWCVDNLHKGISSHIEVFGKSKIHVGEASLDGEIDFSKADSTKTLN